MSTRNWVLLAIAAISCTYVVTAGQQPYTTVTGRITDPAGAPVESAEVYLTGRSSRVGGEPRVAVTNSAGVFRFGTSALGKHYLVITSQGWPSRFAEVEFSAKEPLVDVGDIALKFPDCSSPGVICDGVELPKPGMVPLCDIVKDPARYNGRTVLTRGVLRLTSNGFWLSGQDCTAALKSSLGIAWESTLWLVPPSRSEEGREFERAISELRERTSGLREPIIWVTCVGRLETKHDIRSAVSLGSDGEPLFRGFGIAGIAPAQLLLGKVQDPIVLPSP
jgi:hypothetical protein